MTATSFYGEISQGKGVTPEVLSVEGLSVEVAWVV